ncbi:MAG TPA: sulfatase-like hydrolase/transferase [Polyangiaceae bacterium]|nr:sulfatase-like hydrolase/transferase [Polyangiaceae bacterium]
MKVGAGRKLAMLLVVAALVGCRSKSSGSEEGRQPVIAGKAMPRELAPRAVHWVERLSRCELDRAGPLIDLGSPAAQGLTGSWSLTPDPTVTDIERDGETWARVFGKSLTLRFVLDEPAPVFVALRARGVASRSAVIELDGKPLGSVFLIRGQARILSTRPTPAPVPAGTHSIDIRFSGAARAQAEALAEVDWVRAGTAEEDEDARTYAPPTQNEIIANVPLGGVPHRSVALRAASTVRCTTFVPAGARFKALLGFEGQGVGESAIVASRDGEPSIVLHTEQVKGGDHAAWSPVDVELDSMAGKIVTFELQSRGGTPGSRLLFGDPTLYLATEATDVLPSARLAVVVVMAGIDRARLGSLGNYPALAELQRSGTTFEAHRSPTTVTAGVVASLLTGLSPRAHGLEDGGARLAAGLTTLSVAARDGSVQTAMFSGCPTTFEAFGFGRGWDRYAAYSPVEGAPAVAPITEAAKWTSDRMKTEEARALVVVHARGGHPPWDVTLNEAAKLPPIEYSGTMEPRRAGELIARARAKHSRFRLNESDRTRMWAIYESALAGQDRALGHFIEAIKKANLWDKTLFIVTGDLSTSSDHRAPFGDGEEPTEDVLHVPMWVHFPGGALAGKAVQLPTGMTDLSRTVLDALRLPVPEGFEGVDLFTTAAGIALPGGRALPATLGRHYSLRLGDLILSGTAGKLPALCDTVSDPTCGNDRMERMPRAATLLFRMAYDAEAAAQKHKPTREPATIDAPTAAALQVWGE